MLGCAGAALSGCARTGSSAPEGGQPGYPVTVRGALGATTVDAPPERVVATGFLRDIDLALALRANLVGAVRGTDSPDGLAPWQHPGRNTQLLTGDESLPLERIAALNPDLILASDDYQLASNNAKLRRIAPTLGYLGGAGADGWELMTQRAGAVLGQRQRAERLIEGTHRQIEEVKRRHPELDGATFTFGPLLGAGRVATISSESDAAATFFRELGMRLSPKVTALPPSETSGRSNISAEEIDVLDADVVMIAYRGEQERAEFERNPLFRRLGAVRRGSYVALDQSIALAVAFPSVLSIPYGLRNTVQKLAAVLS